MSRQLATKIHNYLTANGNPGRAKLCGAIGKTERTLMRWLKQGVPTEHEAYKLALACGCTNDEALKLAKEECPSAEAETA